MWGQYYFSEFYDWYRDFIRSMYPFRPYPPKYDKIKYKEVFKKCIKLMKFDLIPFRISNDNLGIRNFRK